METSDVITAFHVQNSVDLELSTDWSFIGSYSLKATTGEELTKRNFGLLLGSTQLTDILGKQVQFKINTKTPHDNSFKLQAYQTTESSPSWSSVTNVMINSGEQTSYLLFSVDSEATQLWLRIDGLSADKIIYTDKWEVLIVQ